MYINHDARTDRQKIMINNLNKKITKYCKNNPKLYIVIIVSQCNNVINFNKNLMYEANL